jgi:hypothetical protein
LTLLTTDLAVDAAGYGIPPEPYLIPAVNNDSVSTIFLLCCPNIFVSFVIIIPSNEELQNLYSSPNVIRITKSRRMRWAGRVAHIGAKRSVCRFLFGEPKGTRPIGRPIRGLEDNITMEPREVARDSMNWI